MNYGENNEGFTIIEVLIAVFILSVGLLAAAAMQATAIGGNAAANNTTISTQLAEEMVDRIRVSGGDNPEYYNCINTQYTTQTATYTAASCTSANSGRPSLEPARADFDQWRIRLRDSGLPNARGEVTVEKDSPISRSATVTVTVTWGITGTRSTVVRTIIETWLT